MKALLGTLGSVFMFTAIITHIWTVVIAFSVGGLIKGIITLFLPFLAEIYWMIKMFGVNDTYAYLALVHLLVGLIFSLFGSAKG